MPHQKHLKKYRAHIALILIALIWGTTFPLGKYIIGFVPVFTYLWIRFLLAALILLPLSMKSLKKTSKKNVIVALIIGIMLFLAFAFQTVGLQYTTAAKVSFATGLYVVLVPFIYFFLFRTPLRLPAIIGSILACIGLALLGGDLSGLTEWDYGVTLVVICAVFTALQIVGVARYANDIDPLVLAFFQTLVVGLCCLGTALFTETIPETFGFWIWFFIIFLAVFATVIAYFVQCWAQKQINHTAAAIIISLESVFGAVLSWIYLDEPFSGMMVIGCVFLFSAMIITQMEPAADCSTSEQEET